MWGNLNIFQKLLCTAHTTISWYFMDHKTISGDKRQHRICMLNSLIERERDAHNPKNSTRKANKNCGNFLISKKSLTQNILQILISEHATRRSKLAYENMQNFHAVFPDNDVYLTSYVLRSEAEIRAHIPWMLLKQVNIIFIFKRSRGAENFLTVKIVARKHSSKFCIQCLLSHVYDMLMNSCHFSAHSMRRSKFLMIYF